MCPAGVGLSKGDKTSHPVFDVTASFNTITLNVENFTESLWMFEVNWFETQRNRAYYILQANLEWHNVLMVWIW